MIVIVPVNRYHHACIREVDINLKVPPPSTESSPVKPERTVRFNSRVSVHVLPATEPLTKQEQRTLWYQKKDYIRFGNNDRAKAKDYRFAKRNGTESEVEVRGLESQLSLRASVDARNRREAGRNAVLKEQARQRKQDPMMPPNPHLIRKASLAATKSSRVLGYNLAKLDSVAANVQSSRILGDRSMSLDVPPEKPRRAKCAEFRRAQSCFVLI
jgi:hypothetical protein